MQHRGYLIVQGNVLIEFCISTIIEIFVFHVIKSLLTFAMS